MKSCLIFVFICLAYAVRFKSSTIKEKLQEEITEYVKLMKEKTVLIAELVALEKQRDERVGPFNVAVAELKVLQENLVANLQPNLQSFIESITAATKKVVDLGEAIKDFNQQYIDGVEQYKILLDKVSKKPAKLIHLRKQFEEAGFSFTYDEEKNLLDILIDDADGLSDVLDQIVEE
eukprot:GHVL01032263.1.p1 GENE.GHVL01032263.1~~GHVL01032263.1.p1  ORF type:complete len:177 (+),score=35.95 GHVL01032263.1:29-559(+)